MAVKWFCYRCLPEGSSFIDFLLPWDERCPKCGRSQKTGTLSDTDKPSDAPVLTGNRAEEPD